MDTGLAPRGRIPTLDRSEVTATAGRQFIVPLVPLSLQDGTTDQATAIEDMADPVLAVRPLATAATKRVEGRF